MRTKKTTNQGFTVPELAVVLAVIVCGVAVMAPYLLKTREAARQVQCRERLKQQADALAGHLVEKSRFPAGQNARRSQANEIGRFADPAEPRDEGTAAASGASWVVVTLPYLGYKDLFDRWDSQRSVRANSAVAQTNLPVLSCPSRARRSLVSQCDRIDPSWTGGGNDYAACSGSGISFNDVARQTWDLDETQLQGTMKFGASPYSCAPEHRGLFGVNRGITLEEIEAGDGLAYVVLLGERRIFRNLSPDELRSSDGWAWGGPATLFSTRSGPHTGRHYDEADSEHPGLVNVALADARVRAINWNIDLQTWNNLGNYAQGSPIEHPEFRR